MKRECGGRRGREGWETSWSARAYLWTFCTNKASEFITVKRHILLLYLAERLAGAVSTPSPSPPSPFPLPLLLQLQLWNVCPQPHLQIAAGRKCFTYFTLFSCLNLLLSLSATSYFSLALFLSLLFLVNFLFLYLFSFPPLKALFYSLLVPSQPLSFFSALQYQFFSLFITLLLS